MPDLPVAELVDGAVNLPNAGRELVLVERPAIPLPSFDNADTFVGRLVRAGALVHDAW